MTERTPQRCDGIQEPKQPSLGSVPNSLCGVRGDGCLAAAACILGCDPESVPATEDRPMCYRNRCHTYRKDDRSASFAPDCMCWHCRECRPRLRRKWINHATHVLGTCGLHLGIVFVPLEKWASFSRRTRKYGLKHMKARLLARGYGVVLGSPVPFDEIPFEVEVVTVDKAVKRFTGWVNSIHDGRGGNPVSSSHAWSLPQHHPTGWTKIAVGPTPAQVQELATAMGVHFANRVINGIDMTICHGETTAMDALCDKLANSIRNHMPSDKSEFNNDSDTATWELAYWRGFPDEEPDPYLVGAVT
jgi:hypothetical protein